MPATLGALELVKSDRARKVAETVARRILADARARGLGPGDPLAPEFKMMEMYDAGRASVREALRILEVQGILRIRTGRSGGPVLERLETRVVGNNMKLHFQQQRVTYGDVLSTTNEIDPNLAWHAAAAASASEREGVKALLEEMGSIPSSELGLRRPAVDRLHTAVTAAAHNPVLALFAKGLREVCSSPLHEWMADEKYWGQARKRFGRLIQSFEAKDADETKRLVGQQRDVETSFVRRYYPSLIASPVRWD